MSVHPIEILRFNTCGSVDDGKSTLIGRLLYDSKNLMEDQIEALERSADITGGGQINLANLTDGLRAEREQGVMVGKGGGKRVGSVHRDWGNFHPKSGETVSHGNQRR